MFALPYSPENNWMTWKFPKGGGGQSHTRKFKLIDFTHQDAS